MKSILKKPTPKTEDVPAREPAPAPAVGGLDAIAGLTFTAVGLACIEMPDPSPREPARKRYLAVKLRVEDGEIVHAATTDPDALGAAETEFRAIAGRQFMALRNGELPW